MSFPKKTPDEIKLVTFDFSKEAAVGATISVPEVTCSQVVSGDGEVADITVGTPAIQGLLVEVLISEGESGSTYRIRCEVDADNGEHHVIEKDLPVLDTAALVK